MMLQDLILHAPEDCRPVVAGSASTGNVRRVDSGMVGGDRGRDGGDALPALLAPLGRQVLSAAPPVEQLP